MTTREDLARTQRDLKRVTHINRKLIAKLEEVRAQTVKSEKVSSAAKVSALATPALTKLSRISRQGLFSAEDFMAAAIETFRLASLNPKTIGVIADVMSSSLQKREMLTDPAPEAPALPEDASQEDIEDEVADEIETDDEEV